MGFGKGKRQFDEKRGSRKNGIMLAMLALQGTVRHFLLANSFCSILKNVAVFIRPRAVAQTLPERHSNWTLLCRTFSHDTARSRSFKTITNTRTRILISFIVIYYTWQCTGKPHIHEFTCVNIYDFFGLQILLNHCS